MRVDRFATPEEFRDFFKACYGPTIAVYRAIADDPDRVAALDADLADLARRFHDRRARPGHGLGVPARDGPTGRVTPTEGRKDTIMDSTTRSAVAAAALALSTTPLLFAPPASADRVPVAETVASSTEGAGAGAPAYRQQQQAYLDRLLASRPDASGAGGPAAPLAPGQPERDGVPVSVVTALTLGGLAAGAGATLGMRRVQLPRRRQVAV